HGAEANPGPFTDEVWQDWRTTTAPYGPLHVLLMRGIVTVTGENPSVGIIVLRMVVLAALAGLVALVIALARRTGVATGAAVWMGCASPLTIVHLVGGLHNEVFPLLACLLAVLLAVDGRAAGAGVTLGLAVAVKVNAVLVAPFLLWILLARRRRDPAVARPVARALADTALAAVAAGAAFALTTLAAGLGVGWLGALSVSDRIINYLSVPTAAAHLVHAVTGPGLEDGLSATGSGGGGLLARGGGGAPRARGARRRRGGGARRGAERGRRAAGVRARGGRGAPPTGHPDSTARDRPRAGRVLPAQLGFVALVLRVGGRVLVRGPAGSTCHHRRRRRHGVPHPGDRPRRVDEPLQSGTRRGRRGRGARHGVVVAPEAQNAIA